MILRAVSPILDFCSVQLDSGQAEDRWRWDQHRMSISFGLLRQVMHVDHLMDPCDRCIIVSIHEIQVLNEVECPLAVISSLVQCQFSMSVAITATESKIWCSCTVEREAVPDFMGQLHMTANTAYILSINALTQ